MSQPISRFLHPFDIASDPHLEPDAKRAILASWASDRAVVEGQPALRNPPGVPKPIPIDDILAALQAIDRGPSSGAALR